MKNKVRPAGIEPASPPWHSGVLPMDHGRKIVVGLWEFQEADDGLGLI